MPSYFPAPNLAIFGVERYPNLGHRDFAHDATGGIDLGQSVRRRKPAQTCRKRAVKQSLRTSAATFLNGSVRYTRCELNPSLSSKRRGLPS